MNSFLLFTAWLLFIIGGLTGSLKVIAFGLSAAVLYLSKKDHD